MIGYNYMYKSCVKTCQNNYNESLVHFKYNVVGHTGIIAVRINNWNLSLLPKYVLTIGASLLPIGDLTTVPFIGDDSMA